MEKSTQRSSNGTGNVKFMNPKQLGARSSKGSGNLAEMSSVLVSVSGMVSKGVDALIEDFSKHVPKATVQFLKKHWKPTVMAATAGVAVGVGTYFLIQKFAGKESNGSSGSGRKALH